MQKVCENEMAEHQVEEEETKETSTSTRLAQRRAIPEDVVALYHVI
jgi:hypothetical protein